jgi:cell division protein FtsI (penicillin-binding protein 3)
VRAADLRGVSLRARLTGAGLLLCFLALAGRAAHLTVIDRRGFERGAAQTDTVLRLAPARGTIVDKTGAELAVTVPAPSVYAVPREVADPNQAAKALARVLALSPVKLEAQLRRKTPFVFVKRLLSPEQAAAVSKLELAGVGLVEEPRRAYPQGALAGPLVGFSNIDGVGARGIEQMEDAWLSGKAQRVPVERDARGRLLAFADYDPRSSAGGDVALTLDAMLQSEAEAALHEVVKATGGRGGLVIVLDPATGDLLALAEAPGFDPNAFRTTPYGATRAHAFLDAADPGSTAKPFVVAAALERGVLAEHEIIDCENGSYRVPGKTLRDTHPHKLLDPSGILRVSSNIGAAKIAFRVGPERHYEHLRGLGFGRPTGSGFPDESAGLLRPWQDWRPVDHATIAFGQGMSVTPIQLANAFAVLANGGEWRAPRLVAARRRPDGLWEHLPASPPRRALRADVARTVLGMLETVVGPEGTGRRAGLRGIRVSGKTGTAQKVEPDGRYSQHRYQAWFAGAVPADSPRFVIVAMVDEPRGFVHTGGATAAPLFARVAAAALARDGILTEPELPLPEWARADWVPPWKQASPSPAQRAPVPKPLPVVSSAPRKEEPAAASAGAKRPAASQLARAADAASRARTVASAAKPAASVRTTPAPSGAGAVTSPAASGARAASEAERPRGRVFLPDLHGLTHEQVRAELAGLGIALQVSGAGRAIAQEPAPGTIVSGGAVRVRFSAGGAR